MTPRKDEGRPAPDRATPKSTSSKPHPNARGAGAATTLRAWLLGLALDAQRTDAALLALAFAGWPR